MNPNLKLLNPKARPMKHFITLLLIISTVFAARAQSFGVGTASPNPKAALDVVSPTNNQGFLAPRLTTAQRTAMSLAAADKGMMVFDIDLLTIFFWNGSAWGITLSGFSSSATAALNGVNTGTGYAGNFSINNSSNGNAALFVSSNGTGSAIYSGTTGSGAAGTFVVSNPSSGAYVGSVLV